MATQNKTTISDADKQALAKFLAELQNDPVQFVKVVFPWGEGELLNKQPDTWQLELLCDIKQGLKTPNTVIREAIASGHGIGKSALVAWIILWSIATHEDTKGVVTANTDTQLKSKTWAELAKWYRLFIAKDLFKFTATSIFSAEPEHEKTWRIDAIPWSKDNPEAFAGLHNQGKRILVIFDEASAIADEIWEVTEGALTDADTQIIWCCFGNPTRNNGRFFECFNLYRHLWKHQQIDSRAVKISNKKQLQEWVNTFGEDSDFVKVRVRGIFPSTSAKQFIPGEYIDKARGKNIHKHEFDFAPTILGVDPSWTGDDEFVIWLRQGRMAKKLGIYLKNDNDMEMAALIAEFQDEHKAVAVFIDMGYGTGIASAGNSLLNRNWTLVSFAAKSAKKGYANKRAEMWSNLKEWLKDGGCIENDDNLCRELASPEASVNLKGEIILESKDEMKRRGVRSPNRADALALTFAYPVAAVNPIDDALKIAKQIKTVSEYDPFSAY